LRLNVLNRADKPKESAGQEADVYVRLSKLPPYQPTALKLLNISCDSASATADFEKAFKADPALTADLLLVANSAQFGARSRVDSIRHAISYLGLERVRALASTIGFSYYVRGGGKNEYAKSIWTHGLATAVIADLVGNGLEITGTYTAGLTHDMGRLALLECDAAGYASQLGRTYPTLEEALESEKELFGMTHCEAGAIIAKQWRFPEQLETCVGEHHKRGRDGVCSTVDVVRLACVLADAAGFAEVQREDTPSSLPLPESVKGIAGLDLEHLREFVSSEIAKFSM